MDQERKDQLQEQHRIGSTGNRENVQIEILLAILEEVEEINKKLKK